MISIKKILPIIAIGMFTVGCSNVNPPAEAATVKDKENETEKKTDVVADDSDLATKLQSNLKKSGIDTKVISAESTEIEGLYWVQAEKTPSFFTDKSGKYVIQGQVVKVGESKPIDMTAKFMSSIVKDKLAAVKVEDMIVYEANKDKFKEPKSVIYAFTDPTCPYCRKLHSEIPALNDLGVEVRLLSWPRHEKDVALSEAVWCSEDRHKAMKEAESGHIEDMKVCDSPVVEQIQLGNAIGVNGTPAVFKADGEQIGGYLPIEGFVSVLGLSDS